jgi:hypothetical protein
MILSQLDIKNNPIELANQEKIGLVAGDVNMHFKFWNRF